MIDEKYIKYPTDVVNNKIVAGKLIKLACFKYLQRFERDDMYFNSERVDKIVNRISQLKFFEGSVANKNVFLEPWQFWIICSIYGWYWKHNNKRVTRTAYIQVARKNSKSTLCACLGFIGLLEEQGAEVDFIANDRKQAKILFSMTSNMIKKFDPKQDIFKVLRDEIRFNTTNSHILVHSADAGTKDGFNSSLFICDEFGAAKNNALYSVFKSSQMARQNPLGIVITTAGLDLTSPCYDMRRTCIEVLMGTKQDESDFAAIYELDENDDWTDKRNWLKCNPNLGASVSEEALEIEVQKALNNTSVRNEVMTKNFNKWCSSVDVWIPEENILECTHNEDWREYTNSQCYVSVDLAAVSDLTAVSLMVKNEDKYKFWTWYFLPETELDNNVNSDKYRKWYNEGYLLVTPGNVTDYQYILNKIMEINQYLYIEGIYYDTWNSTQFAINATEQNLNMCPFSQSIGHFNRGTKELERLLKCKQALIEYNPITLWCFRNVELKQDWSQNVKPVKKGDKMSKIDGVITHIQCLGGYLESPHYINEVIAV